MRKSIEDLMSTKLIPEILDECRECATENEVVDVLKRNTSPALKMILAWAFAPGVEFDVEVPKWKPDPNPIGLSPNSLFVEARRIYLFDKSKDLPREVKRSLLLNILESVYPTEAQLLENLILKRDLGVPLLTYNTVRKAYPEILPLVD